MPYENEENKVEAGSVNPETNEGNVAKEAASEESSQSMNEQTSDVPADKSEVAEPDQTDVPDGEAEEKEEV